MVNQQSLNELALFAGAGGGILGGHLLGWRTVCAVEWEPYPASVLCARQNDGLLPPFPIWDDVCSFDGKPWRGIVDVISGGFPCQDISAAGKGAGIDGERSGMWREMARIIHEVRPRFVFVENSPMLTSRGLGAVLGDLASMGFDAKWGVLGADDIGANHQRDRIWIRAEQMGNTYNNGQTATQISTSTFQKSDTSSTQQEQTCQPERSSEQYAELAYSKCLGREERSTERGESEKQETPNQPDYCGETSGEGEIATDSERSGLEGRKDCRKQEVTWIRGGGSPIGHANWWSTEPNVGRVAHGVAARVDRLHAIGNGQVPAVVVAA